MSIVGVLMSATDWEAVQTMRTPTDSEGRYIDHAVWYPGAIKFKKFRCPSCKRWFKHNESSFNVSCCVQHAPGDCCHFMQTEVHKKGWQKRVKA